MADIKTTTGFTAEIDEELLADYEFLEVLNAADKNPLAFTDIVVFLLGEDGKEALKQHLREKLGRATTEAVKDAVMEILAQLKSKKK